MIDPRKPQVLELEGVQLAEEGKRSFRKDGRESAVPE